MARDLLERALAVNERECGPDHRYGVLGDAAKERDLLGRALAIEVREYGPDVGDSISTVVVLCTAHLRIGDAAKARDMLERALVMHTRECGPRHGTAVALMRDLGNA